MAKYLRTTAIPKPRTRTSFAALRAHFGGTIPVRAVVSAVRDASERMIVLTHGHRDHAGATRELADAIGAAVWGPEGVEHVGHLLVDGDAVETDEGQLVAVHTPGHTSNHLCFYWPERRALFAGDMLLGRGDTTWVAEYPGCVADYFESIDRLREQVQNVE